MGWVLSVAFMGHCVGLSHPRGHPMCQGDVGTSRAPPEGGGALGGWCEPGRARECSWPTAAPDGLMDLALLRALFSVAHSTLIHKVGNTTPCSAV